MGQLSLKKSALQTQIIYDKIFYYFIGLLKNPYAWIGILLYGLSFAVYMVALKNVKLSFARSFSALSYIIVIILSILIFKDFKDQINIFAVIGIILIAVGILFVGFGYK